MSQPAISIRSNFYRFLCHSLPKGNNHINGTVPIEVCQLVNLTSMAMGTFALEGVYRYLHMVYIFYTSSAIVLWWIFFSLVKTETKKVTIKSRVPFLTSSAHCRISPFFISVRRHWTNHQDGTSENFFDVF